MECHGQPIKKNALRLVTAGVFLCDWLGRIWLVPQWRLHLPPQPLQNQRSENAPKYAGQQGKHNISDGHRDNLPSLPDWLGWAVAASV